MEWPVAAGIVRVTERRVREDLRERHARVDRVLTLAALAETAALDPETAVAVRRRLGTAGGDGRRIGSGDSASPNHGPVLTPRDA